MRVWWWSFMLVALTGCAAAPTRADADATAIRATLEQWRQDFNARRGARICELFAPELRADFQGMPELGHTAVCARLRKAMAEPAGSLQLALRIQDVMVSGAQAVVRLTWTSTETAPNGKAQAEDEQGLDVFARQPDGSWKIVRYVAYPVRRE